MFINEKGLEKRRTQRIPVSEPVRYEYREGRICDGAVSSDVSEDGIKIRVGRFLPRRAVLNIKFKMNPISQIIDLQGEVMWTEKIQYSDQYYVGIRFRDISPQLREEIQQHLATTRRLL